MAKSRSFSIYLLKENYDATNSLREDHPLQANVDAQSLPDGATLFVLDSTPKEPWWKSYFDIQKNLTQVSKGALVFLPVEERCFALSFGHVSHNLLEASYEYDFGLRVTLNCLDPLKLKSTDTLDPGAAKRQRTQLPIESDLTLFDFDRDSTILRSLTGKVRDEHKDLFRHATGSSNLRVSSVVPAENLSDLCATLLVLYQQEKYKEAFPDILNIAPVRDPATIELLNARLLEAFREQDVDLNITVPEIINYSDNLYVAFAGAGTSLIYDDVYIGRYYDYLKNRKVDIATVSIDDLSHHSLLLTDEAGTERDRYSLFKSLVFDATLDGDQEETYHLCEGNWYRIDDSYIAKLTSYLNPLCVDSDLPGYNHANEGDYNADIAANDASIACLDKKNISPDGQTAVEPCDLLRLQNEVATFYHVKVSTLSAQLSHLFNQGVNSAEILRVEPSSVEKLEALTRASLPKEIADKLMQLVGNARCKIVFGIVTRKDPTLKSSNLPLFSRISLMRCMKSLRVMNIPGALMFIADGVVAAGGKKKKRKKRKKKKNEA